MKARHYVVFTVIAALCTIACSNNGSLELVPYPNEISVNRGHFYAAGAQFSFDDGLDSLTTNAIYTFAAKLSEVSTKESVVKKGEAANGFVFVKDETIAAEAYEIHIGKEKAELRASGFSGFNYAIQTIRQLLPVEIYGSTAAADKSWNLPCLDIKDEPRFAHRGVMLDLARHFYDIEYVKKVLDVMEVHKMNRLHWHLTDDQGWRIEIKKYPRLTEVGSVRNYTMVGRDRDKLDNVRHGGYFTQEEIRELVQYAGSKGISVIPEIDLPGHMMGALASYNWLGCENREYEVWGRWGISRDVLCVGKEETMQFLEDVMDEVLELFPSEYIHIGGDECPKEKWEKCPVCQAKIKELGLKSDDKFSAEHYLQSYVMKRIGDYVRSKGRKVIGWDEILEGEISDDFTIMSWRGSAGGRKAAKEGKDAIMVPREYFYFDYYQSDDVAYEPLGYGRYIPIEKVYAYEPFTEDMDEEACSHIIGIQANMWGEYIPTGDRMEYMFAPRVSALSEVQWEKAGNRNWKRFYGSLMHICDIYDQLDLNYSRKIFDVNREIIPHPEKGWNEVRLYTVDGAAIRYTLDGSEPDENSPLYTRPLKIRSETLKAKVFRDGTCSNTLIRPFTANKALERPVVQNTNPYGRFCNGSPDSFVDGVCGNNLFVEPHWVGWFKTPMDITIEMDGKTAYSSVSLRYIVYKPENVYNPQNLTVMTSDDNVKLAVVAKAEFRKAGEDAADEVGICTLSFPKTKARYLRVSAMPFDGHLLFADEVIVK